MSNVKIVTDSTADIPQHIAEELNIKIVPLKVHFGEEVFLDGVDIQSNEFYAKLESTEDLPTTSQPSPVDFVDAYKSVAGDQDDPHIISIHISSALSGTYQSALLAQNMLGDKLDVHVIDSKKASYAIGYVVRKVAEAAKNGANKQECIDLAEKLSRDVRIYFLVDTMEYLQKGGRIGKASAVLGSLLNIKPILSLNETGEVYPVDKVRGSKKAQARIMQILKDYAAENEVGIAVVHANYEDKAEQIVQELKDQFNITESLITNIGPVLGTHVGPKAFGVIMIKND